MIGKSLEIQVNHPLDELMLVIKVVCTCVNCNSYLDIGPRVSYDLGQDIPVITPIAFYYLGIKLRGTSAANQGSGKVAREPGAPERL